jgi:hypothetical protein
MHRSSGACFFLGNEGNDSEQKDGDGTVPFSSVGVLCVNSCDAFAFPKVEDSLSVPSTQPMEPLNAIADVASFCCNNRSNDGLRGFPIA